MTMGNKPSAMELAGTYAKYFVEDFAVNVMGHLRGSHGIPKDVLQSLVDTKVSELATESMTIANTSSVGRFIYECAAFAVENYSEDLTARETWDAIKALPSAHHGDLSQITYAAADLYRSTVDRTVVGTIAKDADTTARMIAQAAQSRVANTETGGTFNLFSWGILNDGLWLHGALMKANDRVSIFKPDTTPTTAWANQAFNFAHQAASFKPLDQEQRIQAQAEINLLIGTAPQEEIDQLLRTFTQHQLNDLLFSATQQRMTIEHWEQSRNNPTELMANIGEMSTIVRLVQILHDQAQVKNDDFEIGDLTRERLHQTNEAVTLSLVGYEVMRETRFADTLIMSVKGEGDDPKIDVFVNADTITNYHAAHGMDQDLVNFGLHLDPRQGMPASSNGWSLQYVLERRDNVLPQIMAEDSERLERLRSNDAAVIRQQATKITHDIVQSYLSHREIDQVPSNLNQAIHRFSHDLTNDAATMKMDEQLTNILAIAQGDPFVQKATGMFVGYLNSEDQVRDYAPAATIATLAISDAVNFITATDIG